MKKNILRAAFVVALGLVAGFTAYSSQKDELALSDVLLDNVEALASGEKGGKTCYNTITTQEGVQTMYCGTCNYISGSPSWSSGQSTCN